MTRARDILHHFHVAIRDRTASISVEFAVIVPIMATILFGLFEGTQVLLCYMRVVDATQTVADLVCLQQSVSESDVDGFNTAAGYVLEPFSSADLGVAITSVTFDPNTGVASVAWQDTRGSIIAPPSATSIALAANYGTKGESVIIVQTVYAYSAILHYVLPASLTFGQIAYEKPRLVASIPHT
jgi:Flp pilus assembly protein TadG